MPLSKAKLEANNRYLAKNYESIAIRSPKDQRLGERLRIAANRKGINKREYILNALTDRLEADGVTTDTYE